MHHWIVSFICRINDFVKHEILFSPQKNIQETLHVACKGGYMNLGPSKMQLFGTIINAFQSLTTITIRYILNLARFVDLAKLNVITPLNSNSHVCNLVSRMITALRMI